MLTLEYDSGTIVLHHWDGGDLAEDLEFCKFDPRTHCYRLPAYHYSELVLYLIKEKIPYEDRARNYPECEFNVLIEQTPRQYQREAVNTWWKHRQGYVVLPTGSGKSFVAVMAILKTRRQALVVVPTLDLMHQWYTNLKAFFGLEPGLIGGGYFEINHLTVSTYDSACLHLERIGNQFGLVIFDECHHLPGESYSLAAQFALAPFRLGLTATPERADGRETVLEELIGPCIYRKGIRELAGFTLSEYDVRKVFVELNSEEQQQYQQHRKKYLDFLKAKGISFSRDPRAWSKFIILTSKNSSAREAFKSYLQQKIISQASRAKLDALANLLDVHSSDRIIVFTNDNATVYQISNRFLAPALTHQTRIKERKEILEKFSSGEYNAIVTSKVLNEGVDIPEANVGIILSGSGSVREHVQRLGRILRKQEGKQAVLYEVITRDTGEEFVSQRRTQHEAYRK